MSTLFEQKEKMVDLPAPKPGWVTLGMTKNGQIHDFGGSRKMTLGERLLGKFASFFHVDKTSQTQALTLAALSATGRYEFPIKVEIDFKIQDAAAFVEQEDAVEKSLMAHLRRAIYPVAKTTQADDFNLLENTLTQQLDPGRSGPSTYGMFEVTAVAVDVQPPEGYSLSSSDKDDVANLELRTAARLARGEKEGAENLKTANESIRETLRRQQFSEMDLYSDNLDRIKILLDKRNEIEATADTPQGRRMLEQIEQDINKMGGVPPELLIEADTKPKGKLDKSTGEGEILYDTD